MGLLIKLRKCKHTNTNAYDYIRNDGLVEDLVSRDSYKQRQEIKEHLTGMRFCLDCGATQRFRLRDPLALYEQKEPWLAPWIWRDNQ
jgi:hypothetical protein